MSVTVKSPKAKEKGMPDEYTFEKNWGGSVEGAVDLFGAEVVYKKFAQQCDTDLGNSIRRSLNEGDPIADIDKMVEEFKPGVVTKRAAGIDTVAKRLAAIKDDPNADPEEIEGLRARIAAYLQEMEGLMS